MKQIFLLCSMVFVLLGGLAGCQHSDSSLRHSDTAKGLKGKKASFPDFLVGTWKSEDEGYNWQMKFEPDGKIPWVRHFFGIDMNFDEGGTYEEGRDGAYALYVFGPRHAEYDPKTRILTVSIFLEQYHFEAPEGQGSLEGNSRDVFVGPVSADGKKWHVKWYAYTELYGSPRLPDVNNTPPIDLVFRKAD